MPPSASETHWTSAREGALRPTGGISRDFQQTRFAYVKWPIS
jgi:hypothetical protein